MTGLPSIDASSTAATRQPGAVADEPKKFNPYGPDGRLTRNGMEHIIRNGGSILHGGKVISKLADLPTAMELAGDDVVAQADARKAEEDRIAAAKKQLAADEAKLKAMK